MPRRRSLTLFLGTTALSGALLAPALTTTDASAAAPVERPAKTSIVVAWPADTVTVGSPVEVTGKVRDGVKTRRRVTLQQKLPSGWRVLDADRTSKKGVFRLSLPTHWIHRRLPVRVVAKPVRRSRGDVSSVRRIGVAPAYAPAGPRSAWSRVSPGYRTRFNPCQPITYRVNDAQGMPGSAADVAVTLERVSQATGLRFKHLGSTDKIFGGKGRWPGRTMMVISWGRPEQTKYPIGGTTGAYGGSTRVAEGRDAQGRRVPIITRSGVVMDSNVAFPDNAAQVRLLMHELGHVVGLGHVDDTSQYMNPTSSIYSLPEGQWGAGDLNGLAHVGLAAGCVRRVGR